MITQQELDDFHRFASERLSDGSADLTMPDLLELWALEHPTREVQSEVAGIIRQGDEDIAAGRGSPAQEVNDELRQKFNLPAE